MSDADKPIEILTEDMTEVLPKEVQESVVYLSNNMRPSELMPFNPIVKALLDIKELQEIKYVEDDKDSIKAFKEAKKQIRSFNAAVKKTKTEIKKPYLDIGREIVAMEKGFLAEAKQVMESLEKEFSPYLEELERKKAENEAKKEAERQAEIDRVNAEARAQVDQLERQNAYQNMRYVMLTKWLEDYKMRATTWNFQKIQEEIAKTKEITLKKKITLSGYNEYHFQELPEEQRIEVQQAFEAKREEVLDYLNGAAEQVLSDNTEARKKIQEAPTPPPPAEKPVAFDEVLPPADGVLAKIMTPKEQLESLMQRVRQIQSLSYNFGLNHKGTEHGKIAGQLAELLMKTQAFINPKIDQL